MSDARRLNEKQEWLLLHGVELSGKTRENKEHIKKFLGNDAFYYGDWWGVGADYKWHVNPDKADELVALIPDISYTPSQRDPVSQNSDRHDCLNLDDDCVYNINKETDWNVLYVADERGKKDSAKSKTNLVCPEPHCDMRLYTRMEKGRRALYRIPKQVGCTKCGKTSVSAGKSGSTPQEEVRDETSETWAVPRNHGEGLRVYPHHSSGSGSSGGSGAHSASASSGSTSWLSEPGTDPDPGPNHPESSPVEDVEDIEPEPPLVEEPTPEPEQPAVVPEPETDRPTLTQDPEEPAKANGRPELNRGTLVLGALVLIFLVLMLVLFFP